MKQNLQKRKQELLQELSKINQELEAIRIIETIPILKANPLLKLYSVIIFQDEGEDEVKLGLSSFEKGYIDDHIPEDREEFINDLLNVLPLGYETNSCTYSVVPGSESQLNQRLQDLGLAKIEPAW